MVPVDNVPAVFNTIMEAVPYDLQIDPLLGFFERTWTSGLNGRSARFPPSSWNQTDRVATDLNRTNNYCELLNSRKFFIDLGHSNPTIYNFLSQRRIAASSEEEGVLRERCSSDAHCLHLPSL